jgi:hypothetical protein
MTRVHVWGVPVAVGWGGVGCWALQTALHMAALYGHAQVARGRASLAVSPSQYLPCPSLPLSLCPSLGLVFSCLPWCSSFDLNNFIFLL